MTTFSTWLRAEREARGWSMPELERRIGSGARTVYQWESGRHAPRYSGTYVAIAEAFGVDPATVLRFRAEREYHFNADGRDCRCCEHLRRCQRIEPLGWPLPCQAEVEDCERVLVEGARDD